MPKEAKKRGRPRPSPLTARPSLETELQLAQETGTLRPPKKAAPQPTAAAASRGGRGGSSRQPAVRAVAEQPKSQTADVEHGEEEAEDDVSGGGLLPQALSRKIMQQAETQQKEEEAETAPAEEDDAVEGEEEEEEDGSSSAVSRRAASQRAAFRLREAKDDAQSRASDDDDEDEGDDDEEEVEELELTAEDEASLSVFLPSTASSSRRNLADIIMEKLAQHSAAASSSASDSPTPALDPRVTAVYGQVGVFLSHYTSGKIPKAFKIVPSLQNWEDVLYLTQPAQWSPQAVSAASRLFASGLNEKQAQRFYSLVLLPRVRSDIAAHGKLNYHLYQALRRSLFKPAAFFRGIVLPLCEDGLTAREAVIVSSVLAKYSVPPLHSAVAILRLTAMPYSGPIMLVLRVLLNKKYSLPVRVLEAVSAWMQSFASEERRAVSMPLIWHQVVLVFVQRYGAELSDAAISRVREACRVQQHHAITKEVRRELSRVRDMRKQQKGGAAGAAAVSISTPAMPPPLKVSNSPASMEL